MNNTLNIIKDNILTYQKKVLFLASGFKNSLNVLNITLYLLEVKNSRILERKVR